MKSFSEEIFALPQILFQKVFISDMKETPLIILGAGKSTIEFIDLVNDINQKSYDKIKIIGILDDDKKLKNKKINNISVIGSIKDTKQFKKEKFFVGIFSYKNRFIRSKIINSLKFSSNKFINVIQQQPTL